MAQMLLVLAEIFPLLDPAMGFNIVKPSESICETLLPLILQSFGKLFPHQLLNCLVLHTFAELSIKLFKEANVLLLLIFNPLYSFPMSAFAPFLVRFPFQPNVKVVGKNT